MQLLQGDSSEYAGGSEDSQKSLDGWLGVGVDDLYMESGDLSVGDASSFSEEEVVEMDAVEEFKQVEKKSVGAELWMDASLAGMPRVFVLNTDRKVCT